jgi:hypothetical protein
LEGVTVESLFETDGKTLRTEDGQEYQLVEAEPPSRVRTETPVYDKILKDFADSGLRCVRVVKKDVQISTISNELRKSKKRMSPEFDSIDVLLRKDEDTVYLLRK